MTQLNGGGHDADGRVTAAGAQTCGYCKGGIPRGEAVDLAGHPLPMTEGFEWVDGGTTPYHRECTPDGDGPWLPWTANGVLSGE